MSCAWERCWRGAPGGTEPKIHAKLAELLTGVVMLLCPRFQPGIFACDNPQVTPAPGVGCEHPSPEAPWFIARRAMAAPPRGAGFSIQNGSGEDKNKNLQELGWDPGCFHLLVVHGGAGCRSPAAGSTQGCEPTELLAHFPQGNLTPCPQRPRRSPRAASTPT